MGNYPNARPILPFLKTSGNWDSTLSATELNQLWSLLNIYTTAYDYLHYYVTHDLLEPNLNEI